MPKPCFSGRRQGASPKLGGWEDVDALGASISSSEVIFPDRYHDTIDPSLCICSGWDCLFPSGRAAGVGAARGINRKCTLVTPQDRPAASWGLRKRERFVIDSILSVQPFIWRFLRYKSVITCSFVVMGNLHTRWMVDNS